MDKEEVLRLISNLLESAENSVESALTLGRQYDVPVDLNIIGLQNGEDLWYVSEYDYRKELEDEYSFGKPDNYELTEEEKAEVEARLTEIRNDGGYDNGYKVLGWMSSSTNC